MHNQKINSKNNFLQISNQNLWKYGLSFAQQVSINFIINPVEKTEPIWSISNSKFLRKLDIENKNRSIFECQEKRTELKF